MKATNFKTAFVFLVMVIAVPGSAVSQTSAGYVPGNGTTPTIDTPGSPDGSYALNGFDTINYPNGRLNFALPLLKIPGRGQASANVVLHIESRWTVTPYTPTQCNQYGCNPPQWSYAPNFSTPYSEEPAMVGGIMLEKWAGNFCQVNGYNSSQWSQIVTKPGWVQADGSEVEFRDEQVYGKPETGASGGSGTPQNRGTAFESFDANSYQFTAGSSISDPTSCTGGATPVGLGGTITTKNGLQYVFSPSYSYLGYPTLIEDRNGNQLTISYPNGNYLTQNITDPFNRTTTIALSEQGLQCTNNICAVSVDQVNYPVHKGSNPPTENINIYRTALGVQYTQQLGNKSRPMLRADYVSQGIQTYTALFGGKGTTLCSTSFPCVGGNDPSGLPAEVLLPDGTAYEFYYDTYANLARVELPTGGAYEYDWNVYLASGGSAGANGPASYSIVPYITQKRVYSATSTLVEKLLFSGVFSGTTTVQYQDGIGTVIGSEVHTYVPPTSAPPNDATQYPGWQEGLEIHLQSENSAGTIIKDIGSTYNPRSCPQNGAGECWFTSSGVSGCTNATDPACPSHDTQLTLEQTTYNGITAQNSYAYDVYNNRTSVAEYPYGNTVTPARTTSTSYITGSYVAKHILDLPQTETVYSGAANGTCGGTGNCVTTTTWNYDESARPPQSCTNILGHDSNFGVSYTTRGNATSILRYADSSNTLTSLQTFDIGGNLVTSVDQRGVTKSYSFADSNQGAAPCTLPTAITSYTALNTTSGGYSDTFTYDYNIQKPLSHTDWNNQTTNYAYNDSLNRLTQATRPDQAYTKYSYVDSAGNVSVTSNTDQTAIGDQKIVRITNYDGLGRKSQVSISAPEGALTTCYTYDARNRLQTVSNPQAGGCSSAITSYAYDILDRPLSITWQDSSVSTYVYAGYSTNQTNTTLEVDPQKNDRLYYYDAQNRLVEVDENVTSWQGGSYGSSSQSTYKTTYGYDALDDLNGVCQNGSGASCTGGLQRTFVYDGLKRLTSAVNPESGTISYGYDASNNVTSLSSARNIITSFLYDGLNRPVWKHYTDGTTPWVTYSWDLINGITPCGLGIGHLCLVQSGNSYNYRNFDLMGRVISSSEYLTAPNGTKQGWAMYYGYDYADEPTSFTFPSGRVQNTNYDQAKRLTALFDNFNSVNVDVASRFGYYPNGTIEDVYLGNSNTSQTHQHTTLNSRLQVTGRSSQVNSTDGSPTLLTLGFNYPSSPSNNGNMTSESITTNGGMGSSGINITQSFGYDAFNRLQSMSETSGLSQSYGYDAYGNRALTAGYAPSPYLTPTSTSQFTGNRWLGSGSSTAGYDASGNQTQNTNGGNAFTFDADNRMITSNIGNMGVTSYAYDGEGRRIEKTSSTFTSYYVYDFSGTPVAEYTTEIQPVYGTLYVTPDHLGSTRLLTNGNGDVVRRYDYLPFGEEIPGGSYSRGNDYGGNQYPNAGGSSFPGDAASHKFTGKERDWETGLDFFGARYFSGAQGRFTSADWSNLPVPIPYGDLSDPQTLNLYAYVRDNPLVKDDADGHGPCEAAAGGGTNAWLRCKGVSPTITSSDNSVAIGPLRKSEGTQVGERIAGAIKGAVASALNLGDAIAGANGNSEAGKLANQLAPSTQDEQFGGQVFSLLSVLLPSGQKREIQIAAGSFEEARKIGLGLLGEINETNRVERTAKFGDSAGLVNGFKTWVDGVAKDFRVEWDPAKGAHINVSVGGAKWAIGFPGSAAQVTNLLKNNVGK